jgi:predicted MFS family arabinose efflux permease
MRDLRIVLNDLWRVARSRAGVLALLIVFLPIGTGAASNLWAAVADDWHASANTVALVTGVAGGVVSMAGCLIGGYLSDRMNRKSAYMLYGALQAACAVAMALSPRTETMYIAFTMTYALITGLTYAGFSAVVLEAIGLGAAATKYTVFASLSNMPIAYMTVIEGWAQARWNVGGMLLAEAFFASAGLLVFIAASALARRRWATA